MDYFAILDALNKIKMASSATIAGFTVTRYGNTFEIEGTAVPNVHTAAMLIERAQSMPAGPYGTSKSTSQKSSTPPPPPSPRPTPPPNTSGTGGSTTPPPSHPPVPPPNNSGNTPHNTSQPSNTGSGPQPLPPSHPPSPQPGNTGGGSQPPSPPPPPAGPPSPNPSPGGFQPHPMTGGYNPTNEEMKEEIRRRKDLNRELSAAQYAMIDFHRQLASGDIKGAIGTGIGNLLATGRISHPIAALLYGVKYLGERAVKEGEIASERTQVGALELSPSAEQTVKASGRLRRMAESQSSRQAQANELAAYNDQLIAQAEKSGTSGPGFWKNLGISFGASSAGWLRYGKGILTGETHDQAWARSAAGQEALRQSQINRAVKGNLEDVGATPQKMAKDIVIPGVEAQIFGGGKSSGALGYQSELQVNSLQRLDASNAVLQEQLKKLNEIGQLLTEIKGNTNGLENTQSNFAP